MCQVCKFYPAHDAALCDEREARQRFHGVPDEEPDSLDENEVDPSQRSSDESDIEVTY